MVFTDHLYKIALIINKVPFTTLGNTVCLQTVQSKLMQSLICCSDIIKLWVAKIKGGWIKQHPVAK